MAGTKPGHDEKRKSDLHVQPHFQKYSHSLPAQITCISPAIPSRTEGRFAIVTDVGHGMRWTWAAHLTRALIRGRRSRVVLTPRRWRQVDRSHSVGDGGKQARSPGRARNKLLKPLRGECRATRRDRGDLLACFLLLHARLRAHRAPGIPCSPLGVALRPLISEGETLEQNSGASRGEIAKLCRRNEN